MTVITGAPEIGEGDAIQVRAGSAGRPERIFGAVVVHVEIRHGPAGVTLHLACDVTSEAPQQILEQILEQIRDPGPGKPPRRRRFRRG